MLHRPTQKWQVNRLFTLLGLTTLLAISWLWAPLRTCWQSADLALFYSLNRPIAESHLYALGWAIMNMRPVDALVGVLLFSLILRGGWTVPASRVRHTMIAMVVLLLWMVLLRVGFTSLLDAIHWSRASPSETLSDAIKLTQVFPGWDEKYHLKDGSPISFPGDHASVLLIWAMWVSRFVSPAKQAIVWCLALFFSLPRLVAGAHWLSDDLVGGLAIALFAYGTAVHTPLLTCISGHIERFTAPLWRLMGKLPLLRRMHFFTQP